MAGKQVAVPESATPETQARSEAKMAEMMPFMKIPNELARNSCQAGKISTGTRVLRKPLRCYTPTAYATEGPLQYLEGSSIMLTLVLRR